MCRNSIYHKFFAGCKQAPWNCKTLCWLKMMEQNGAINWYRSQNNQAPNRIAIFKPVCTLWSNGWGKMNCSDRGNSSCGILSLFWSPWETCFHSGETIRDSWHVVCPIRTHLCILFKLKLLPKMILNVVSQRHLVKMKTHRQNKLTRTSQNHHSAWRVSNPFMNKCLSTSLRRALLC